MARPKKKVVEETENITTGTENLITNDEVITEVYTESIDTTLNVDETVVLSDEKVEGLMKNTEFPTESVIESDVEMISDISPEPLKVVETDPLAVDKKEKVVKANSKTISKKEMFLESISKTPFSLYQNGILLCTYNTFLEITAEENYFALFGVKYNYKGLEFRY